ncbi:PREDICTED: uncharacterized protein LOC109131256 [Camelina sativa]|uniref:Uncharacterized protein LOC109131256 n=1 Tax=Camelina sativa TaxID=90675 RepID=A0ABM1RER7_CAMSA|nr:PREDICTED: uncharacterized protein LOC109131256 [Camelina sativa]
MILPSSIPSLIFKSSSTDRLDSVYLLEKTTSAVLESSIPLKSPSVSSHVNEREWGFGGNGYLDGSTAAPPLTITTDGAVTTNPDYTHWQRQDQLIYSALLGAISVSVHIWEKLSSTYANPSRGHVQQTRQQITQWKKGSKSIDEYVQGFVTRFEQLALLGKPMDHDDQIEFIVDGLSEDYKQAVDQIQARDVTPSITEVHEKLLNYEIKLLTMVSPSSITPISANTASYRPSGSNNYNSNNNQNTYSRGQSRTNYRGNNHQHHHYQQRSDHSSRGYQGKFQICGIFGHSARRCLQLAQYSSSQPRANVAAASSSDPWLLHSGATHHVASDLANLSLHQPYNGGEAVVIGNDSGLPITHTCSTLLPSITHPLHLNNVLYVPLMQKNLISILHVFR